MTENKMPNQGKTKTNTLVSALTHGRIFILVLPEDMSPKDFDLLESYIALQRMGYEYKEEPPFEQQHNEVVE